MFRTRFVCLLPVLCCLLSLSIGAAALEVDCDSIYCFRSEDFSQQDALMGICITGLPDPETGTVMLDNRVIRAGDILTTQQLSQMTFAPLQTDYDQDAVVTYLPIYENRVEKAATVTISIRGKVNQAPVAEDQFLETYKNLANEASLKVSDPEGEALTYTVTRQPKRGQITVNADGTFVYTPKKNKVGVDSFVYTATDAAGNVSRQATVTIRILKPGDAAQYSDTIQSEHRFAAEWLKNTGLFVGEQVGGQLCFNENRTVTRGEFLTMALKALNIPVDEDATFTGYTDQVPNWLKPYLAAAMRSGMTAGLHEAETGIFGADQPITGAEAAVMLQNALDLTVNVDLQTDETVPVWAAGAVSAMSGSGISIPTMEAMTRGQVAQLLYAISCIAQDAPGLQMYQ